MGHLCIKAKRALFRFYEELAALFWPLEAPLSIVYTQAYTWGCRGERRLCACNTHRAVSGILLWVYPLDDDDDEVPNYCTGSSLDDDKVLGQHVSLPRLLRPQVEGPGSVANLSVRRGRSNTPGMNCLFEK